VALVQKAAGWTRGKNDADFCTATPSSHEGRAGSSKALQAIIADGGATHDSI